MKSYKIDGNNRVIFSKDMKLVELIDADYRLLSVLLRLNIVLPYGDVSVEEMCSRYGMSSELFLIICQIYSSAAYEPDFSSLSAQDAVCLVNYLRASHLYYMKTVLPRIMSGLDEVLQLCGERQQMVLEKFCRDYVDEVRAHLEYEEREIFPYVEALVGGGKKPECSMSEFMNDHTDICEKIDDMKSIIIKYLPESCSMAQRCDLLFDIFALREDLARHTLLEIKILAPLVEAEERRLR